MDILILDSTSKSLRAVLGESIATSQVDFTVHYADTTTTAITEGNSVAVSNGVTNVEIAPAPASLTRRVIRNITAYNADTVSHSVSIMVRDTATDYLILKISLGVEQSWSFGKLNYSTVSDVSAGILETQVFS